MQDPSVYLLAGTEEFLKEEHLAKLKSAFLDQASQDFNFNSFYGGSHRAEQILECASCRPFLGNKRLVLVRQFEELALPDKELICAYIRANPPGYTLLVLETRQTNLRQGIYAEITKFARVVFCAPLTGSRLREWVKAQVRHSGKLIDGPALQLLLDNLGSDLQLLAGALRNLVLYLGARDKIEVKDVELLTGRDFATSAFELFETLVSGQKERTLQILDSLLKDGVNAAPILGALAHKLISEEGRIRAALLPKALEELQQADTEIKTGRKNPQLALELLVARLLQLFEPAHQAGLVA